MAATRKFLIFTLFSSVLILLFFILEGPSVSQVFKSRNFLTNHKSHQITDRDGQNNSNADQTNSTLQNNSFNNSNETFSNATEGQNGSNFTIGVDGQNRGGDLGGLGWVNLPPNGDGMKSNNRISSLSNGTQNSSNETSEEEEEGELNGEREGFNGTIANETIRNKTSEGFNISEEGNNWTNETSGNASNETSEGSIEGGLSGGIEGGIEGGLGGGIEGGLGGGIEGGLDGGIEGGLSAGSGIEGGLSGGIEGGSEGGVEGGLSGGIEGGIGGAEGGLSGGIEGGIGGGSEDGGIEGGISGGIEGGLGGGSEGGIEGGIEGGFGGSEAGVNGGVQGGISWGSGEDSWGAEGSISGGDQTVNDILGWFGWVWDEATQWGTLQGNLTVKMCPDGGVSVYANATVSLMVVAGKNAIVVDSVLSDSFGGFMVKMPNIKGHKGEYHYRLNVEPHHSKLRNTHLKVKLGQNWSWTKVNGLGKVVLQFSSKKHDNSCSN